VTLTPFWKHFADGLRDLLITQYNLAVPVFIWILVTFRGEDRRGPIGLAIFGPVREGGESAGGAGK